MGKGANGAYFFSENDLTKEISLTYVVNQQVVTIPIDVRKNPGTWQFRQADTYTPNLGASYKTRAAQEAIEKGFREAAEIANPPILLSQSPRELTEHLSATRTVENQLRKIGGEICKNEAEATQKFFNLLNILQKPAAKQGTFVLYYDPNEQGVIYAKVVGNQQQVDENQQQVETYKIDIGLEEGHFHITKLEPDKPGRPETLDVTNIEILVKTLHLDDNMQSVRKKLLEARTAEIAFTSQAAYKDTVFSSRAAGDHVVEFVNLFGNDNIPEKIWLVRAAGTGEENYDSRSLYFYYTNLAHAKVKEAANTFDWWFSKMLGKNIGKPSFEFKVSILNKDRSNNYNLQDLVLTLNPKSNKWKIGNTNKEYPNPEEALRSLGLLENNSVTFFEGMQTKAKEMTEELRTPQVFRLELEKYDIGMILLNAQSYGRHNQIIKENQVLYAFKEVREETELEWADTNRDIFPTKTTKLLSSLNWLSKGSDGKEKLETRTVDVYVHPGFFTVIDSTGKEVGKYSTRDEMIKGTIGQDAVPFGNTYNKMQERSASERLPGIAASFYSRLPRFKLPRFTFGGMASGDVQPKEKISIKGKTIDERMEYAIKKYEKRITDASQKIPVAEARSIFLKILGDTAKGKDEVEKIKSGYKALARQLHSDKGGDAEKFKFIASLYKALSIEEAE